MNSLDHIAHSVVLVRHGITDYNREGRIQGTVDIPLNETGLLQVEETAKELSRHYLSPRPFEAKKCIVVSSDLSRAMRSAQAFASKFPQPLEIHPDIRARERGFGDWEGMLVTDIHRQFPQDAYSWQHGASGELAHGAEPRVHVGKRGEQMINEWARRVESDADVVIFAHGAWIAQTIQRLLGAGDDEKDYRQVISPRNAFWSRLIPYFDASGDIIWRLVEFNHGPIAAQFSDWEHLSGDFGGALAQIDD